MSQEKRQPQSGLKTVKRDWSISSQRSDTELIPWDPSPPRTNTGLTTVEKRLKRIKEALADRAEPLSIRSNVPQKRPAPSSVSQEPPYQRPSIAARNPIKPSARPGQAHSAITRTSVGQSGNLKSTGTATSVATTKTSSSPATVFLSPEQTQIKNLVEEGHSIFYTGSAGTGKSVLLREIIKSLKRKYIKSPDSVAITASTGIAACNIGGVTIHSFAGIGLGVDSAENLAKKVRSNKKACARWLRTKVLIIDEVSMLDGDLFDKLSRIGCILRKKPDPFGGIQVVVTGDFFQLPPVTRGITQVKFAFESTIWSQTMKRTFNLTKVFRQSDQEFVNMLNEMRFGKLSAQSIAKFKSLQREIVYEDGLGPTELFPRREDVDRSNTIRIRNLDTEERVYIAKDEGSIQDPKQREKILSNFMAADKLILRVDAQVMLIKNLDETLVNGSMGRVVRFSTESDEHSLLEGGKAGGPSKPMKPGSEQFPVVEFTIGKSEKREYLMTPEIFKVELPNGEIQASRKQVPLILAWAMSIHKSQGQTLDRVKVDLAKIFEKGQSYVALSRATSLEGLQVLHFDHNKVKAHHKVVEWSKTLETV